MCYMGRSSRRSTSKSQVGIRELRQNLSVYLERVVAGEALQVTDRGRPVAMLVPLPEPRTAAERLVASGRAQPPAHDLLTLGRPTHRPSRSVSVALQEIREERL